MSKSVSGLIYGLLGVLTFATTLPVTSLGLADFSAVTMGIGRAFIAGCLALAVVLVTRQAWPQGKQWLQLAAIASGVVFGFPFLIAKAMQTVPAAHGGIVLGLLPLSTACFGALVGGERPSPKFWIWAVIGSALVIAFAITQGDGYRPSVGDLWLLASAIAAGLGYAFSGGLSRSMPGWLVISWALVISLPLLGLILYFYPPVGMVTASTTSWAALIWVSLIAQYIGFFFWNKGLADGGIAKIGQLQLFQIFFTIGIAALLLDEKISWSMAGFAVAVFAAVFMARKAAVTSK